MHLLTATVRVEEELDFGAKPTCLFPDALETALFHLPQVFKKRVAVSVDLLLHLLSFVCIARQPSLLLNGFDFATLRRLSL